MPRSEETKQLSNAVRDLTGIVCDMRKEVAVSRQMLDSQSRVLQELEKRLPQAPQQPESASTGREALSAEEKQAIIGLTADQLLSPSRKTSIMSRKAIEECLVSASPSFACQRITRTSIFPQASALNSKWPFAKEKKLHGHIRNLITYYLSQKRGHLKKKVSHRKKEKGKKEKRKKEKKKKEKRKKGLCALIR